eukprot:2464930-Rhodomonas_salina.4
MPQDKTKKGHCPDAKSKGRQHIAGTRCMRCSESVEPPQQMIRLSASASGVAVRVECESIVLQSAFQRRHSARCTWAVRGQRASRCTAPCRLGSGLRSNGAAPIILCVSVMLTRRRADGMGVCQTKLNHVLRNR